MNETEHIEDADIVIDFRGGKDTAKMYRKRIKQLKDQLTTAKAENERLQSLYCEYKLCRDCGKPKDEPMFLCDKGKPFDKLKARNKRLRDALQSLYDQQNGPPLLHHEKEWQEAMNEAEKLLGEVNP